MLTASNGLRLESQIRRAYGPTQRPAIPNRLDEGFRKIVPNHKMQNFVLAGAAPLFPGLEGVLRGL